MKLVIAYVQPERVNSIKQKLFEKNITKMSLTNALGCGQQMGYTENYRGSVVDVTLLKKARFEVAINDEFLQSTLDAIIEAAKSGDEGKIGDGKIFVLPIEECVRIRTGERGIDAIG